MVNRGGLSRNERVGLGIMGIVGYGVELGGILLLVIEWSLKNKCRLLRKEENDEKLKYTKV